jgi:DNA-binding response OmpR family regulator
MPKMLVVDDEKDIRSVITRFAKVEGFDTLEAGDGMEAIHIALSEDIDVIIMDIMMPRLNGFTAYKEISEKKHIPAIMLTAKGEEYDKLHGFELGIDDYVVKPFSPKEVMARAKAVLKRSGGGRPSPRQERESFGGLDIDFSGRSVASDGRKLLLTPKEMDLLFCLVRNKNLAMTRDMILNHVWGFDYCGDDRVVDAHIKMLRKSLGKNRKYIVTLRSVGYKFET